MKILVPQLNDRDLIKLKNAKYLLEKDSIAIDIANIFGMIGERAGSLFSSDFIDKLSLYNMMLIDKTWDLSMTTMSFPEPEINHIYYVTLSGAIGGVGITTLFLELPVTTVLMLRAVADIAQEEGENYQDFETKIAALEVFALGGDVIDKETEETGYYAIRASLDKPLEESSKDIAKKGAAGIGAPFGVQLIGKIAAKHQAITATQVTVRTIPLIGAVAGAIINAIFLKLFQDKARGHFIIRNLERKYGTGKIKSSYSTVVISKDKGFYRVNDVWNDDAIKDKIDQLLKYHVWASMGFGIIPIPFLDFVSVTAIHINLLRKLAQIYHVPFSKDIAKKVIGSLIGGVLPVSTGTRIGLSMAKVIPGLGLLSSSFSISIISGATTYAIGKIYNRHFAEGGTFLSFEVDNANAFYEEMFQEGIHFTSKTNRGDK